MLCKLSPCIVSYLKYSLQLFLFGSRVASTREEICRNWLPYLTRKRFCTCLLLGSDKTRSLRREENVIEDKTNWAFSRPSCLREINGTVVGIPNFYITAAG